MCVVCVCAFLCSVVCMRACVCMNLCCVGGGMHSYMHVCVGRWVGVCSVVFNVVPMYELKCYYLL